MSYLKQEERSERGTAVFDIVRICEGGRPFRRGQRFLFTNRQREGTGEVDGRSSQT